MKIQWQCLLVATLVTAGIASALDMASVQKALDEKRYEDAIGPLVEEIEKNPANEGARILLAQSYEQAGQLDDALAAWTDLKTITLHPGNKYKARLARNRILRIQYDERIANDPGTDWRPPDYLDMKLGDTDYRGLQIQESKAYMPPPPGVQNPVPAFAYETEHLTVYTSNEKMGELIGKFAERYIGLIEEWMLGGERATFHFPLIVYLDPAEYQSVMGPGSLGVTYSSLLTGRTNFIAMFQNSGKGLGPERKKKIKGPMVYKTSIEDTLFHELFHAMMNEYFGTMDKGFWLNEGMATRSEQFRRQYAEAARMARRAGGGTMFRLRDLFEAGRLPGTDWRYGFVYEQGAAITLFLFECGPDAIYCFMKERVEGNDWDSAVAAALGIPKEGAVEEFERRWHQWLRRRYAHDSDLEMIDAQISEASDSDSTLFLPWVNEVETVNEISDWRDVDTDSLEGFTGVGRSLEHWSTSNGRLRCDVPEGQGPSLLGIHMFEEAPVVVTCDIRYLGTPGDDRAWFGFTQLDADRNDTRIEVSTPLADGGTHSLIGLWSDDLAIYIDGKCTGRFPAEQIERGDRNINYPIALVAYGPVEVENLRVGKIEKFSRKVVPGREEEEETKQPKKRGGRRRGGQVKPLGSP